MEVKEYMMIFSPGYILNFFFSIFILRNHILNFVISKGNKLNAQLVLNLNYNYIAIPNVYASQHLRALGVKLLLFSICFGVKYFHFIVFDNILEITQVLVFLHCKMIYIYIYIYIYHKGGRGHTVERKRRKHSNIVMKIMYVT